MQIIFDTNGNDKQKECARHWINDSTTEIVYGGSKGSGKSFLGCTLSLGDALIYPGTHYFIARRKLNDLRKFTIPSIHEVLNIWKIPKTKYKYNGMDSYYEFDNGSKVFLIEAKYIPSDPRYERFGSMQMTRGWIEEAGEIDEDAKNNLGATIGRWRNDEYSIEGKLLMTCNPSKNFLYREYYKKFRDGILEPHKAFIQALPQDNKMLPKGYLANLERTLNTNQKERLLFGNWEYDDDPSALISFNAITDYFNPTHLLRPNAEINPAEAIEWDNQPIYITADIARKGRDKTIARVWKGLLCIERKSMDVSSVDESVNMIRDLQKKHNVRSSNVLVDEDGVGGGVKDYLKCRGFINNSRPLRGENYEHLKAQCTFRAAELIEQGKMGEICDNNAVKENTIQEMEQVKMADMDVDGKRRIIKKDAVKALIGRSPDEWDSIMMRAYYDIKYQGGAGKYVIL